MANSLQDTFVQRQKESADKIGNVYDQQYNAQAANLKTAYDQNMSNLQAQQQKIAPQYRQQSNQMVNAYEQNRRNLNLQNMVSGMGSGTAVQQQEALNNVFQKNYAGLKADEASAYSNISQQMANAGVDYRQKLNEARADAENKKAASLVQNQNQMNDWYDQQAKLLAGYGDFSAYERLYGPEATEQMKNVWMIQNPEAALGAGLIDKKRYKELTGKVAKG